MESVTKPTTQALSSAWSTGVRVLRAAAPYLLALIIIIVIVLIVIWLRSESLCSYGSCYVRGGEGMCQGAACYVTGITEDMHGCARGCHHRGPCGFWCWGKCRCQSLAHRLHGACCHAEHAEGVRDPYQLTDGNLSKVLTGQ